jgi:hypothetical protein
MLLNCRPFSRLYFISLPRLILCIGFLLSSEISIGYASSSVDSPTTGRNITIVDSEGIVPVGIQTEPSVVRVGDSFNIDASIFNYSPLFVRIPDGGCSPTGLSATFDGNVAVSPGAQFVTCYQDALAPAGLISTTAGWPYENYTATSPGLTNATLHLVYSIVGDNNNTEVRQYDREFQFTIVPARQFGASN